MSQPPGRAPTVSVVMPVFNPGPFLDAAVDSILQQTFTDFELIIVDDGSDSDVGAHLAGLDDPRVRVVRIEHAGQPTAGNHGRAAARGRYLACMDADDVSVPTRLADQVAFLDAHPDVAVVSGSCEYVDEDGSMFGLGAALCEDVELQRMLFVSCPFVHSSVMCRREAVAAVGGYDPSKLTAGDYDLWARLLPTCRAASLPVVVVRYRVHGGAVSEQAAAQHVEARRTLVALWSRDLPPRWSPAAAVGAAWRYARLPGPLSDRLLGVLLISQLTIADFVVSQHRWRRALGELGIVCALAPFYVYFLARRWRHGRGTALVRGSAQSDAAGARLRARAQPLRGPQRAARVVARELTSSGR